MPNPAKPVTRVNRLLPHFGQTEILVEALLRFSSESLRQAFITYLGEDLPANTEGVAIIVDAPATYTAPGEPGMFAQDEDYLYVYTGDGTTHRWPRVPLAHGW